MTGKYKPFSKKLFNAHDPKSRVVVKQYLKNNGIIVNDNPDKYGVDLISEDETLKIEIEHRPVWVEQKFPFDDVNILERKAKFFKENNVCYIILSKTFEYIGMIDGKTLRQYLVETNLIESSNKYVKEGEMFYKVPSNVFKWDII